MQSLGAVLDRAFPGRTRPDPASPDEVERWLLDRRLWSTNRIVAELESQRESLAGYPPDGALHRATQATIIRLEQDVELGRLRDRLQAARPAGCWCYGLGGSGRVALPMPDGETVSSWRVWCNCPEASALRAQVAELRAERDRAEAQQRLERLWGSLPRKYRDWTLESLEAKSPGHRDAVRSVREWADDARLWALFLHGPWGHAKTGLGVGAIKLLADRGCTALYQDTTLLLDTLRSSYAGVEALVESRDARWESLFTVDVLLLDDLGAERHRRDENVDWPTEQLWKLIGYRHREERRMIVTSNLTLADLSELLGHGRIPSRLGEAAKTIDCTRLPRLRGRATT